MQAAPILTRPTERQFCAINPPTRVARKDCPQGARPSNLDNAIGTESSGDLPNPLRPVRAFFVIASCVQPQVHRHAFNFSSLDEVPITFAPNSFAKCRAKRDTPPVP